METSKIWINILIVTAIALIGTSIATVLMKKPEEVPVTPVVNVESTPVVEDVFDASNTPEKVEQVATTTDKTQESSSTPLVETSTGSSSQSIKGITEKKWTLVSITTNKKIVALKKANSFTITLNTDLSIKGTTDCNSYFGTFKLENTKVTFGPLGSTRMFCDGSQENEFMTALQDVKSYSLDKSNELVLVSASSTLVFK